ncbi:MAG: ExbD/TolR family protein [Rhodothermales bacterium]
MPILKKKERSEAEIPTASMADIAFLLLIFFLVTTTIDVDTGIGMVLPPKLEDDVIPPPVKERNMLKILVSETGQVLLEDKPSSVDAIRDEVVTHVTNMGADPNYSERPGVAVISIKTSSQTPYNAYIGVLDEVWMGYFSIWNSEARAKGALDYKTYTDALGDAPNEIRKKFPAAISIAEPDDSI